MAHNYIIELHYHYYASSIINKEEKVALKLERYLYIMTSEYDHQAFQNYELGNVVQLFKLFGSITILQKQPNVKLRIHLV